MVYRQIKVAFLLISVFLCGIPAGSNGAFANGPNKVFSGEDVVLRWNRVLTETILTPGQHPGSIAGARSYAMMHAAIFDAVNSIDGSYTPYLIDVPGTKHASIEAAASRAAHDVLLALYPGRAEVFSAELAASIASVTDENRIQQGLRFGREAAAAILAARTNDGWTVTGPSYVLPTTPGNWQPTPSAPAAFTHYPGVKPFALNSSSQFIPPPPPALTSPEYAAALNEVKSVGSLSSTTRTPDQTNQATTWLTVATPVLVAVVWNNIARTLAVQKENSTVENARMFALMNISHHDGFQTAFASKFTYGLWRPVTAIQRADEDGNPETEADPAWTSRIGNPPYPTYAGNMAAIGMSNAGILALFFGRDDLPVQYTFPNGLTRSYGSLSSIADEMAKSREYGGIHFRFDSVAGQSIGLNTSNYVYLNFMRPR